MPSLIERIDIAAATPKHVRGVYNVERAMIEYTVVPDVSAQPRKSQKALYGNTGMDSWLWSNIASGRNNNLRNDQMGYAMAYLLVPDVRTCVDIMAYSMAQVVNKVIENSTHDRANDKILAQSDDVNPRHIFYKATRRHRRDYKIQFLMRLAYMYILFDEMYVWPIPNEQGGFRTGLAVLNTLGVDHIIDYAEGKITGYRYTGIPKPFDVSELAYDHGFNPVDDLRGSSILQTAIDSINILRNLVRYLSDFFANNARPGMVASFKEGQSDPKNIELLKTEISRYIKGLGKQHNTFISPLPLDWLTLENPDLQKQYSLDEPITRQIYRAFGIPMAMAGDTQATGYKEAPAMFKTFVSLRLKPHLQNISEFITDAILPMLPDTDNQRFEFDLSEFNIVTDDDKAKSEVVATELQNQLTTLDKAQERAGLVADDWSKDRIIIEGLPVKRDMVDAIIEQRFLLSTQTAVATPDNDSPTPPAPPQDTGADAPDAQRHAKVEPDNQRAYAYIPLSNNRDVLKIVRELQSRFTDDRIEWQLAPTYHVTLCYAEVVTDKGVDSIANAIRPVEVELQGEFLDVFDTPDGKALHIRLGNTTALVDLQADVYDAFEESGKGLSEFSNPANYNPHITLAYMPSDIEFSRKSVIFNAIADTVIIGRNDFEAVAILHAPEFQRHAHSPINHALDHAETWRGGWTVAKARQELAVWQRKFKAGNGQTFNPEYTRGDIADVVMAAYESETDIEAAFDMAFEMLPLDGLETLKSAFAGFMGALQSDNPEAAQKSLQSIRLDFEGAFEDVLAGIRSGAIDNRRRAGNILRQIIRTFGARAYRQGLADGGVMDDPTDEEQAEIAALRNEQSAFVSNITRVLIREDGITDVQAAGKPDMWFRKTILAFYYAALESAARNMMMEFTGVSKPGSCATCKRLRGQRHRLKDWALRQLRPQRDTDNFICKGFNCDDTLLPVAAKARGKF